MNKHRKIKIEIIVEKFPDGNPKPKSLLKNAILFFKAIPLEMRSNIKRKNKIIVILLFDILRKA